MNSGIMSTREVTPADIEAAYERVAYPCVRAYNLEGFLVPSMTGFALGEKPGTLLDGAVPMPDSLMKTMFSQAEKTRQGMVRRFVSELLVDGSTLRDNLPRFDMPKPSLVVLACEGWMASTTGDLLDEALKVGGVCNMPGRTECIMLFVHTNADTFMGFCPIEGEPKRASLAPLLPGQFDGRTHFEGPMTTGPLQALDTHETETWSAIRKKETP
jgi:hypothetical protein